MNSRDYKLFRPGYYYHVYNRGDNREPIFLDEQDYSNFIKRVMIVMSIISLPNAGQRGALRIRPFPKHSFSIIAYCLMPNHFHILIRQNKNIPIGDLMIKVCISYAKYFNHKYQRVGNIFQDTFKAKLVDSDEYLCYLSAYIHNNPIKPLTYKYSSISDYVQPSNETLCDTEIVLGYFKDKDVHYLDFVKKFTKRKQSEIDHLLFEE